MEPMRTRPDHGGPAFDDDLDLMRSFDRSAWDEVIRRHGPAVARVARMHAPQAVDDVVQQTFVAAWLSRLKFKEDRGSLSNWLCAIAQHKALNIHRFDQRHHGLRPLDSAEEMAAAGESPHETTSRREDAADLWAALGRLSAGQRDALILKYFGEMSHAEIQHYMNAPLGTVKGRIRLGLDALRADLEPS